jgi:hypothetical protein
MMCAVTAATHQQLPTRASAATGLSPGRRERLPGSGTPESPLATRVPRRSWRDPRLLVGIAIVAVCILLGARLLAAADDTVAVWSVRHDMLAGTALTPEDLQAVHLRFGSPELAGRYLSAAGAPPAATVVTRDVAAGELLPRGALGSGGTVDLVEVPVALPSDAVPSTLRAGELVDIWVTPSSETGRASRAVRVLEQVRVMAVPHSGTALGPSSTQQVVVGVRAEDEARLATALAQLSDGSAVVVRRG